MSFRSRVVNPKWIAGAMGHGYKGASEMAATLDFLFACDATANCVKGFMYQGVADAYLFNASSMRYLQGCASIALGTKAGAHPCGHKLTSPDSS